MDVLEYFPNNIRMCLLKEINSINYKALEEAQITPEKYKTLSVRVSGWNARFITLSKEWQQMIINESKYGNNK